MVRFALIALFVQITAAAPAPVVRASIASHRPIIVGQAVHLDVTVFVPNYFTGSPDFPQINIQNAIVVLPSETPRNLSETIAGQSFAGIAVTYLIYPQQPGTIQLPPVEIGVKYASDPPESTEAHVPFPSLRFDAEIPPEAADLDYFLPTTSLTITQRFDKPLKNLKVGDTIARTVTITASKLRAMLIPPTKFETPQGVAAYPKQPAVEDVKTNRGEFVEGKRVDSTTYLIRKEGDYTLPAIQVDWWNLAAHKVQTAVLSSIQLRAAPHPGYHPALAPEPEPVAPPPPPPARPFRYYLRMAAIVAIVLGVFALLLWIFVHYGPRIVGRWRASRLLRQNSEAALFATLRNACCQNRPEDAYKLLLVWLHRISPGDSLASFLSKTNDPSLTYEIESLTNSLYGRPKQTAWSGKPLVAGLQRVRNERSRQTTSRPVLPALNARE